MDNQRKQIFLSIREVPPDQRPTRLAELCAGDESLMREVAALLSYHGHSGDLLDSWGAGGPGVDFTGALLDLPERLPGYRVEGVLGVGAMGVVYRAREVGGGLVAVKLLRGSPRDELLIQLVTLPECAGVLGSPPESSPVLETFWRRGWVGWVGRDSLKRNPDPARALLTAAVSGAVPSTGVSPQCDCRNRPRPSTVNA